MPVSRRLRQDDQFKRRVVSVYSPSASAAGTGKEISAQKSFTGSRASSIRSSVREIFHNTNQCGSSEIEPDSFLPGACQCELLVIGCGGIDQWTTARCKTVCEFAAADWRPALSSVSSLSDAHLPRRLSSASWYMICQSTSLFCVQIRFWRRNIADAKQRQAERIQTSDGTPK